jgi:hypothetical protein
MKKWIKPMAAGGLLGVVWSLFGPTILYDMLGLGKIIPLTRMFIPLLFFPSIFAVYISSLFTCSSPSSFLMVIQASTEKYSACLGGCCDNMVGFILWVPLTIIFGLIFGGFFGVLVSRWLK